MTAVKVGSWGRYPPHIQSSHDCFWRSDIARDVTHLADQHGGTLAFGKGRSYGDSCLAASDHVLNMCSLDRLISVDWGTGIIVAESGVTLESILSLTIPHGWFLPVTPGTRSGQRSTGRNGLIELHADEVEDDCQADDKEQEHSASHRF